MVLVELVNLPINLGTVTQMIESIDKMVRSTANVNEIVFSDLLTLVVAGGVF